MVTITPKQQDKFVQELEQHNEEDIYSSYSPNYTQRAIFYQSSTKEYVKVSDGAELLVYYTKHTSSPTGLTIVFVPGWSTAPYSWNDTWDELHKYFDLYVIETREKRTSKVKWEHKGPMDRHAQDIKEVLAHYQFNPEKTILMGPCFGGSVIARVMAQGWFKPRNAIFASSTIKFPFPRSMLPLAYIFPSFFYRLVAVPLLKMWMSLTVGKGIQRKTFFELFDNGDGFRWKKSRSLHRYDARPDFSKVETKSWIFGTVKDRVHNRNDAQMLADLMSNGEYKEVQSYYFMHHNPGCKEWVREIMELLEINSK